MYKGKFFLLREFTKICEEVEYSYLTRNKKDERGKNVCSWKSDPPPPKKNQTNKQTNKTNKQKFHGILPLDRILRASREPQESDETWAGDDSDEDDDEDVDDAEDQHSSGSDHWKKQTTNHH